MRRHRRRYPRRPMEAVSTAGVGSARETATLSELRTEGVMVVMVPGTGGCSCWRRRGKVGSSWGFGHGSTGRGLLGKLESSRWRTGGRPI